MPSSGCKTCALRSEEHTSELQSHDNLVCRLLLQKIMLNIHAASPAFPVVARSVRKDERHARLPRSLRDRRSRSRAPSTRADVHRFSYFLIAPAPTNTHLLPRPPPPRF